MATSKSPKKAVKKAQQAKAQQAKDMMLQAAMQAEMIQQSGPIDPEIQAQQVAMQVPTVNPYGRMGTVPPNVYDYDNRVSDYVGVQPLFNPEV